jgi:hypothetical protein
MRRRHCGRYLKLFIIKVAGGHVYYNFIFLCGVSVLISLFERTANIDFEISISVISMKKHY